MYPFNQSEAYLTVNDVSLVPRLSRVKSRKDVKLKPFIYSAPMDMVTGYHMTSALSKLGEHPVVSRFLHPEERHACIKDFCLSPGVWFAIGLNGDLTWFLNTLADIVDSEPIEEMQVNVALDVAHGDMTQAHEATKLLSEFPFIGSIMSGSVCTPSGAERAWNAGCTHIRCGVGPGAACITRQMTGCGIPNLEAVYTIWDVWEGNEKAPQIIADGGIKYPGDAMKYFAVGADAIMLGSRFSKAIESPGWQKVFIEENPGPDDLVVFPKPEPPSKLVKKYRGQASAEFQEDFFGTSSACPEGKSSPEFEWDGVTTAKTIVDEFRAGVAGGLSYLGCLSMDELIPSDDLMVRITPAGQIEGTAHGV